MKNISILHIRNPLGWYAVEEIIATLAEDLKPRGFNTVVVSLESGRQESLFLRTLGERGIVGTRLLGYGMFRLAQLLKLIEQYQADLLHTHTHKSDLVGVLAAKRMGKKVIATAHGWIGFSLKLRVMGVGNRVLLKYFDKVISPSKAIASRLKGIPPSRIELIHNCVDAERLACGIESDELERNSFHRSGENILAVIGRLSPEKGHRYLFEAMVEITRMKPDLTLLVVGDGPLKVKLIDLAERMGISRNVVFTGYRKDIGAILSLIDLLVVPSLNEGFCLPVIEALAFGKAVVATSVGVVTEVANEYDHVSLVSPRDSRGLASAILNSLSSLGEPPKKSFLNPLFIPEKFSRKRMVDEYERVYRELLDGRG